jgi:hypothetical protein
MKPRFSDLTPQQQINYALCGDPYDDDSVSFDEESEDD